MKRCLIVLAIVVCFAVGGLECAGSAWAVQAGDGVAVGGGSGDVEVSEASGRQRGGAGAKFFGFLSPVFLFTVLCVVFGGVIVGLVVRSRLLKRRAG